MAIGTINEKGIEMAKVSKLVSGLVAKYKALAMANDGEASIEDKDVAKLLKAKLAEKFPGVKFP